MVGGVLSAGPDRHGAAARRAIPQVVSAGALDMVNFHGMDTVPPAFAGRTFYRHTPAVTLMRTTPDECREIARRLAAQLNRSTAPVTLVLPLGGVSMIDAPGQPFHDPEADRALFETLRESVGPTVRVVDVDAHINDPLFADTLVREMLAVLTPRGGPGTPDTPACLSLPERPRCPGSVNVYGTTSRSSGPAPAPASRRSSPSAAAST